MFQQLETERLILRQWVESDLEPYSQLCADEEVMRWIGNGSTRTRAECAEAIERFSKDWMGRGFGLFALEVKHNGRFIGFCGLSIPTFLPEVLPAVEIGWRLHREEWGQGLATEAAQASMAFGFEHCGLQEIVSIHQVGNAASARIMEKLGMAFERATVDPSCSRPVHVYRKRP